MVVDKKHLQLSGPIYHHLLLFCKRLCVAISKQNDLPTFAVYHYTVSSWYR